MSRSHHNSNTYQRRGYHHDDHDDDEEEIPRRSYEPSPSPRTMNDEEEPRMTIRVIAPATLGEGYTFDVLVDDSPYTVEVPPGGVKEGQEFEVLYEPHLQQGESTQVSTQIIQPKSTGDTDEETKADNNTEHENNAASTVFDPLTGAPHGKWRRPLLGCCDVLTQSTFWMGCCCTPILLAQLITRFGLTWDGRAGGTPQQQSLSFNRIILSLILVLALWKIPILGDILLIGFWIFIMVHVGSHVRKHVRKMYGIPPSLPQRCHRIEDGCCMVFCGCCSAIQMARHTHNDKEYPGHGCTTTGLGLDAPSLDHLREQQRDDEEEAAQGKQQDV